MLYKKGAYQMSIGKLTRTAALCVGIALLTLAPGIGAGAARAGLETWAGALICGLLECVSKIP